MGCFADAAATKFNISREEQDAFAIQSYKRTAAAWEAGAFADEVVRVEVRIEKETSVLSVMMKNIKMLFLTKFHHYVLYSQKKEL